MGLMRVLAGAIGLLLISSDLFTQRGPIGTPAVRPIMQASRIAPDGRPAQPLDATGWFRRAADQMNIRQSSSPPFHLKVVFHALPGTEFVKTPEVITGDGVYDEMWLSHGKWRREITLGNYHAVEVQSGRDRKVQASSDYEPSRILMLLEALLNPIPRDLLDTGLSGRLFWSMALHSAGRLSYMDISRPTESINPHGIAFIFLPDGMLVQSNDRGLVTSWQDEFVFGGKAVPRVFTVQEAGKKVLEATVEVQPLTDVDDAAFNLSEGSANEGMTLLPLHTYETRHLENLDGSYSFPSLGTSPPYVFRFVVDRHGSVRELELGDGTTDQVTQLHSDFIRKMHWHPAEIDGNPCEVAQFIDF